MDFEYETSRLLLKVENETAADKVLAFYQKNRPYFDAWELTRPDNFYTRGFQGASLQVEYNEIIKKHLLRFWLYEKDTYLNDSALAPIIGSVSISNIRLGGFLSGMFGYKLDHDKWGMGYALEACKKLIEIAFTEYGLHRLESFIMPANERSLNLIQKLCFSYEGIDKKSIEVNHHYEDHLRYALLNDALEQI